MTDTVQMPLTLQSASPEDTEAAGAALARTYHMDPSLPPFVALFGDLGVGKTAFVRGFITALSPGRVVRSPTFTLVNEHRISGERPVFHFDMYRIESEDDLYSIGYDEYLDRGICLVEWCEHIPDALPDRRIEVHISKDTQDVSRRMICLTCKEGCAC